MPVGATLSVSGRHRLQVGMLLLLLLLLLDGVGLSAVVIAMLWSAPLSSAGAPLDMMTQEE